MPDQNASTAEASGRLATGGFACALAAHRAGAQDNAADAQAFAGEYGVKLPLALDEGGKYPVSDSYGLTNVPTLFWISPEGKIELSSVGWAKAEMERFNLKLAAATDKPAVKLF